MDWLYRFDPNPQWYVWALHIITILSTPIYIIGMLCVICVSLTSNGSTYKYLLAINVTMSYITQLSMSFGTIPVFTLPGAGGYPLGVLYKLGVSTCVQGCLVFTLLAANALSTLMLFFYRSNAVIPFRPWASYAFISYFIICAIVIPTGLETTVCLTLDTNKTRDEFQKESPDIFALLPDHALRGTLLILDFNILLECVLSYFVYLISIIIIFIAIFVYRVSVMLRRQIFSAIAVQMHRTLVHGLVIQTIVYYSLYIVPISILLLFLFCKPGWQNVSNLMFIVIAISDPASAVAMILAHKKYRNAVMRAFGKAKTPSMPVSNISLQKQAKRSALASIVPK